MALTFAFDATKETPETAARRRAIVAALMGRRDQGGVRSIGEGIGQGLSSLGEGIAANILNSRADRAEQTGRSGADSLYDSIVASLKGGGFPEAPPAPSGSAGLVDAGNPSDVATQRVAQAFGDAPAPTNSPKNWEQIRNGIFAGESGGDYDALFGFSNRPGKQFANTKLTDMSVDQALAFANPSGPYGQWVKGQVGRVATPMGAYQVVGSTLGAAKKGLGLTGQEQMTPATQDRIGQWILANQGTGAWAGYKGPRATSPAVAAIERAAPTQVASLDPSIGASQPQPSMGGLTQANVADYASRLAANLPAQEDQTTAAPSPLPVGTPMATTEKGARVVRTLTDPQPMGGAPMPMQGAPAPDQPPQVAQAQTNLSGVSPMAGGTAGVRQPGAQPTVPMDVLMRAAGNPWLNENQRAVVEMLLKQQMDPSAELNRRYREAQIRNIESEIAKRDDPNARDKFGNSVIWGQDENGNWVAMQPSSGGGLIPAKTPDGIKLSPPGVSDLNLGTRYATRDRNGNIIGSADIDNAGKAADTAAGKAQGEAAASYRSMASKLPGLEKVVGELNKLAGEATYTYAGQTLDAVRRQFDMDPRGSAVARTKYIAMVDNQILPLLRDTFGAQFTVQEGESLRATLGDPDKTPAEKKEVLDAFIQQKRRDIEALALQSMQELPTPPATGNTGTTSGGVKWSIEP